MQKRLIPYLIITLLTLVFFVELLLDPTGILYSDSSDFVGLHIPARQFLVRSVYETGELPLWDPNTFAGSPFVHDIQQALFYPPHWLLLLVPEESVASALSWMLVLHVWLAGIFMYWYARRQDLDQLPALVAAFGYMFPGRWLLHLLGGGHYFVGFTWVPLVILCLELAIRHGRLLWATLAGVAFSMILLSFHPQWTFYSGLLVATWSLGEALKKMGYFSSAATRTKLGMTLLLWIGFGLWTVLIAVSLAAVQLLPTMEATRYSMRAAGLDPGNVMGSPLLPLLLFVGPSLHAEPVNLMWEDRGGLTLIWLITACLASLLNRGVWRYRAGVAAAMIIFACGGYVLFLNVPGFSLFRQHPRILVLLAFPLSLLAASTIQTLFVPDQQNAPALARCRSVARLLVLATAVLVIGLALRSLGDPEKSLRFHIYWASLLLTVPLVFWLLWPDCPLSLQHRQWLWCFLLMVDLWALTWPLVQVRDPDEVFAASACVNYVRQSNTDLHRLMDQDLHGPRLSSPMGTGVPLARTYGILSTRGHNPIDVFRYKEYLQRVTGEEKTLKAFDDSGFMHPVIEDFSVNNRNLLNLLGVRYLLQPTNQPKIKELEGQTPPFHFDGWEKRFVDPNPQGYDLEQGLSQLPSYTVYENTQVLPRAFVVPYAKPLPDGTDLLPILQTTDFRKTVFLEDAETLRHPLPAGGEVETQVMNRQVRFITYQPNRVVLEVDDGPAGILVLTDVYYPGWVCTVDGEPQPIYRANSLYRAVPVEPGTHTVTFTFEPPSYQRGRYISLAALALVAVLFGLAVIRRFVSRSTAVATPPAAGP
jgi:hypothetical protein